MGEGVLDLYKSTRKRKPNVIFVNISAILLQPWGQQKPYVEKHGNKTTEKRNQPWLEELQPPNCYVREYISLLFMQFASSSSVYFYPDAPCWQARLWTMSFTDSPHILSLTYYNDTPNSATAMTQITNHTFYFLLICVIYIRKRP